MKTKTVRVDELEGAALMIAYQNSVPSTFDIDDDDMKRRIKEWHGDTVEVPAELVEVSDD